MPSKYFDDLFRILTVISISLLMNVEVVICYKEFISKYDIVDFQILESRNKRTAVPSSSLNYSSETAEKKVDLEILFKSFGKNFYMLLLEDNSFQKVLLESHVSKTFENNSTSRTKFYEGYLKDSSESNILGFFLDDLFTGKITDGNQTYFIEPASVLFNDMYSNSRKIVVYRDADIRLSEIFPRYPESFPEWKVVYRTPNISANITVKNSGLDIDNQTGNLFCEIEIVADHTLYHFFQNDTDRLSAVLYFHSKYADYVFRRTDFNLDGKPDNIRIVVGKMSLYKSDKDPNYPMLKAADLTEYLTLFASRRQDSAFCLSIGMFYRKYYGTAVGEAFKAEIRYTDAIGGICDHPLPNYIEFGTVSLNTGVINMQFQNGQPLPLAITMLAFTHEIGHGFGSEHDPLSDPLCSPGKVANHLMYPVSAYGSKNAMKFSRCSREAVRRVLLFKGSCLKYRNPLCGNGIREGVEECDCGTEKFCSLIDPCCTPSDARPPEKGCTVRSKTGFKCSPKEKECCNKKCLIIKREKTLCYSDEVQCLYSFCDGKSADCPKPQKTPELCAPKFTCDSTTCSNVTICASRGLKDCLCNAYLSIQCLQCCQKDNECIPALELGIVDSEGKPFILKSGTSCNGGKYECDNSGQCSGNIYRSNTSSELYISLIAIPFFVSVLLLLAIAIPYKKSRGNYTMAMTNSS